MYTASCVDAGKGDYEYECEQVRWHLVDNQAKCKVKIGRSIPSRMR